MEGTGCDGQDIVELIEEAVVAGMQAYANVFDVPLGASPAFGSEDMIRIRRLLRECTCEWTIATRASGVPPERVIVRLKDILLQRLAPARHGTISEQAVRWCIVAYYQDGQPS